MSNLLRLIRPGGQIGRNSIFAVTQGLITLVCLFGAYRTLTATVGIEAVGLWSLLVAGSFVARTADVSGAGALSRFVATHRAGESGELVASYVHTVLLTTMLFNLVIGGLFFAASTYLVTRFVEPAFVADAIRLIPYVIFSAVFLGPLALGVNSAIDGVNRADQRAIILSLGAIVFLIGTWLLVPRQGVVGFATAQIIQQLFVIVTAWIVLRLHIPEIGFFPSRWRKPVFMETTAFGLKLQVNALASVLSEPLAKFLLSHWGGLAAVGYYEFATRLVFQLRGLIVAAVQPLVASFAALKTEDAVRLNELLSNSTRVVLWASVGATAASIVIAPVLSLVLLGKLNRDMLLMVCALAFGAGLNTMSVPFYFAGFAKGIMRWNILAQIQMALAVIVIGLLLGPVFGSYGIVTGLVTGLAFGSIVIVLGNGQALGVLSVARRLLPSLVMAGVAISALSAFGAALFRGL